MSDSIVLRRVAGGSEAQLLNACHLESGGVDAFGAEAVGTFLRQNPFGEIQSEVAAGGQAALFGQDRALFADLYDGHVARLWCLLPDPAGPVEPAVAVAFDPDLRQARGDLLFEPREHPRLDAAGIPRVRAAAQALAADRLPANLRIRTFVLRAFGDGACGAVLFAVYALSGDQVRSGSFGYAAALWDDQGQRLVCDRPWRASIIRLVDQPAQPTSNGEENP